MKDIYQVIKNVRLSEKATLLQETNNEVTLEVDRKANKLEIKQAVEQLFGKTVVGVRTANYDGKLRRNAALTPAAPTTGKKPSFV
jgi:large subunit ribosomal protein L23